MDKLERVARALALADADFDGKDYSVNHWHMAQAAIAALEPMDKPRVKPLVWYVVPQIKSHHSESVIGEYRCAKTANKDNCKYMVTCLSPYGTSVTIGYHDGLEAAKAAAQADYEARIRAALEPVTVQEAARVLLMVEEIEVVADVARQFRISEPAFFAALRALAERGE